MNGTKEGEVGGKIKNRKVFSIISISCPFYQKSKNGTFKNSQRDKNNSNFFNIIPSYFPSHTILNKLSKSQHILTISWWLVPSLNFSTFKLSSNDIVYDSEVNKTLICGDWWFVHQHQVSCLLYNTRYHMAHNVPSLVNAHSDWLGFPSTKHLWIHIRSLVSIFTFNTLSSPLWKIKASLRILITERTTWRQLTWTSERSRTWRTVCRRTHVCMMNINISTGFPGSIQTTRMCSAVTV